MRLLLPLLPLLAGVRHSLADDITSTTSGSTTEVVGTGILSLDGTLTTTISEATLPTGDYLSYSSTITLSDGHGATTSTITSASANATAFSNSTSTSTTDSLTVLVGGGHTMTLGNSTANATHTTSSSPSASPVINTRPCNNYPELCNRKYSNITMVAAHNSPFDRVGNAASNQAFDVVTQLNDGIRMRKFVKTWVNKVTGADMEPSAIPNPLYQRNHISLPYEL